MENRNANTKCAKCEKAIYRRPFEIEKSSNVFCSRRCRADFDYNTVSIVCPGCNKNFKKTKGSQKFCSKKCSGKITRNRKATKRLYKNATIKRIQELKGKFTFSECMVEGCNYNKTFDIHRLIEGKNRGEYVLGNMFAICPNHHAEVHRGITRLERINDYTLRAEPVC